jgi:hypothetical protein
MSTLTTKGIKWAINRDGNGNTVFSHGNIMVGFNPRDHEHLIVSDDGVYATHHNIGNCLAHATELVLNSYAREFIPMWRLA